MTPTAAIMGGADGWVMELDVAGVQVVVCPVEGRGAPYRVDVLGNAYFRAETMERSLEFAATVIEGRTKRAVDRAWLAKIASGFDAPEAATIGAGDAGAASAYPGRHGQGAAPDRVPPPPRSPEAPGEGQSEEA
jgi:hypothetical protein